MYSANNQHLPHAMNEDDIPKFRTVGDVLTLEPTPEANAVVASKKSIPRRDAILIHASPPATVEQEASARILRAGCGSLTPRRLLAYSSLQFGQYRGQTFKWILENAVGWAVGFLKSYERENVGVVVNNSALGINKQKFHEYAMGFSAVVTTVEFSRAIDKANETVSATGDEGHHLLEFGEYRSVSWHDMYSSADPKKQRYVRNFIMKKADCKPGSKMCLFKSYCEERDRRKTTDAIHCAWALQRKQTQYKSKGRCNVCM